MAERRPGARRPKGVLDTSVVIDLPDIDDALLPLRATITAVTLAELSQGPHLATTPQERSVRLERLQVVEAAFPAPLTFDAAAPRRYGSLVALVLGAGRAVGSRRIDLMVAATAAAHALPLFTRNAAEFEGVQDALDVVAV